MHLEDEIDELGAGNTPLGNWQKQPDEPWALLSVPGVTRLLLELGAELDRARLTGTNSAFPCRRGSIPSIRILLISSSCLTEVQV